MRPPSPDSFRSELLDRIHAGSRAAIAADEFNELALAIFAFQYSCNAPYRAYCERRGAIPGRLRDWTEVPAVPTDAFKAAPLVCGDTARVQVVFRTSGTTAGAERRGRHYFPDLALYDAALRAGFRDHLLPDGARLRMLSLVPMPAHAPDSSLAHMVGEVMREFGAPGSESFVRPAGLDLSAAIAALKEAERTGEPACLVGTSLSFAHLLDGIRAAGERIRLPETSRMMDTGGSKGRARELSRVDLYAQVRELLEIAPEWCVNEYGMTEMSSQFYDTIAGDPGGTAISERLHRGPPWVRTRAVDPETLELLPDGELGVLRHWDLANIFSVMALQTEDLGICDGSGLRVLGRARGAEARGCSIAMDELLSAIGRR